MQYNKTIQNTKMIKFDYLTKENIKVHNPYWSKIRDCLYRILIIGGCGSGISNII